MIEPSELYIWAAPAPVLSPTAQVTVVLGLFHFLLARFPRWISTLLEFPTSWSLLSFRLHHEMASLGLFPQNSTIPHSARIQVLSRTLEQQVFMTQLHLLLLCLQKQNSSEWLCRHSLSGLRVPLMVTLGKHFPLHPFWSKEALIF